MYLTAPSLDDLLRKAFKRLLASRLWVHSSRGLNREIPGAVLRLTNPRARVSRTETRGRIFSGLGEFLWYMAGSNSLAFIEYYVREYKKDSDDGRTLWGAYGPRLLDFDGTNQLRNVISRLRTRPESRKTVVQVFDANDLLGEHKDIPCTCTLQFFVREGKLHAFTNMRSNDAYLGLPHDFFCFTMLQEFIAAALGIGLGPYTHTANSLHLYQLHEEPARALIEEGWQNNRPMPAMPEGDHWPSIRRMLTLEEQLRLDPSHDVAMYRLSPYWLDLAQLLKVFALWKSRRIREIRHVKAQMHSDVYEEYIRRRQKAPR